MNKADIAWLVDVSRSTVFEGIRRNGKTA